MTKSISPIAHNLARQLAANLAGHKASGDAFVISIYGEWGIGKSRCLKEVERLFRCELDRKLGNDTQFPPGAENFNSLVSYKQESDCLRLVVPIFFVPWQYEHEEHLVIPLLKTIEHQLGALRQEIEKCSDKDLSARAVEVVKGLGDLSVALLSAFTFKLAPLQEIFGVEVELDPSKAFEEAGKRFTKKQADFSRYESLYFNARRALEDVTAAKDGIAFSFVVLVDDLDRCLPEKAIQVLESVKLFLNAPNFAFVLAVDDVVVERGIQHRYRDFRLPQEEPGGHDLPITGAQYLEKIVQLPVHLPRWTKAQAESVLRISYPELFGEEADKDQRTAGEKEDGGQQGKYRHAPAPRTELHPALLPLLLRACPLVPRKLIRAVEGLLFKQQFVQSLNLPAGLAWNPLHALRLVLLQQLYPKLFHLVREKPETYWRLFITQRDLHGNAVYPEYGDQSVVQHKLQLKADESSASDQASTRDILAYLQTLEDAHRQRGGNDPLLLVRADPRNGQADAEDREELSYNDFAEFYLHCVAPLMPKSAVYAASVETVSVVKDTEAFLQALLHPDEIVRRKILEEGDFIGRRLPDAVFDALQNQNAAADRITDPRWLEDLASILGTRQLMDFYQTQQVLDKLAKLEENPHG